MRYALVFIAIAILVRVEQSSNPWQLAVVASTMLLIAAIWRKEDGD